MFKHFLKATTILISTLATSLAFAEGGYLGAGLGVTSFFDKVKETGTPSGSFDDGTLGGIASAYAGYLFTLSDKCALGLEGFANRSSARIKEDVASIPDVTTTKYLYSYGVRVVPAYQIISNADLHFILGYAQGEFNLKDTYNNLNKNFRTHGYQLGLGSLAHLTQRLSLRGDLIYTDFQSKKTTASSGSTFNNQISTFDGLVSLVYYFS